MLSYTTSFPIKLLDRDVAEEYVADKLTIDGSQQLLTFPFASLRSLPFEDLVNIEDDRSYESNTGTVELESEFHLSLADSRSS